MSELENKLDQILSDPNAMSQIMKLAESLNSGGSAGEQTQQTQQAQQTQPLQQPQSPPDLSNTAATLSQLASGLDPKLLSRLLPALQQMNRKESSETTALLYALRPFLRQERRDKVERAAQLAKLVHLAKVFFAGGGFHV